MALVNLKVGAPLVSRGAKHTISPLVAFPLPFHRRNEVNRVGRGIHEATCICHAPPPPAPIYQSTGACAASVILVVVDGTSPCTDDGSGHVTQSAVSIMSFLKTETSVGRNRVH